MRRRGGGDPLRATGDLRRDGDGGLRRGDAAVTRLGPSFSTSADTLSFLATSLLEPVAKGLGGGETFFLSGKVNFA